jgi:pSer/pThr/pTyr-binding forkhead associated (FHA) protein
MPVANRSASAGKLDATVLAGVAKMPSVRQLDVVLKPLARPELDEIRVDDALFAIGRAEPAFASYGSTVVNMLSRRHACIFRKDGLVYLADLESRNGTSVNHVGVGRAPCELRDGDEICFADTLSYRVQITPRGGAENSLTLTLTPEATDLGLDPIAVTQFPFLVSKTEPTFSRYKSKSQHARQLGYLSRRQAYIYQKGDQVYIEDLGSGNGTFIDGVRLERAVPLQAGVVVGFGGQHFAYRVSITRAPGAELTNAAPHFVEETKPVEKGKPVALATPAPPALPVVPVAEVNAPVEAPPAAQAQALVEAPPVQQAQPPDEAKPFDKPNTLEMAKPIGLQVGAGVTPAPAADSAEAVSSSAPRSPPPVSGKTQFMAAPTSFLDIFCDAAEPKEEVAPDAAPPAAAPAKEPPPSNRRRGRAMLLLSELASLNRSDEPDAMRRGWWRIAAVVGVVIALVTAAYLWNAPERDLKNAVARGDYARAAVIAAGLLEQHPDDAELKAWVTDTTLKANVPVWLAQVRAGDFDGAKAVLTRMSQLGKGDPHLRPMIDELEWLGNLERLVNSRGGPEAPIRIYADEDNIDHLIGGWNDETGEHQRALARIASHVPQFGDFYGAALTSLRRLQSESTVYLPVIERVKTNITTELGRDNPDALKPLLKETAEKYPGLGGLDRVRGDLASYIEIRREVGARKSGRLFALLREAHFVTPPFQQAFRAMSQGGQLPPAELLRQYDTATQAWKEGNTTEALAGLQKMAAGAWSEDVSKELERRGRVSSRFAELQQSRNAGDYVDQLLVFRESLDANEDAYFLRATAADLNQHKDSVIARAQDSMNRARTLWEEYRNDGAIDASQRIETSISERFRTAAHLLAEASRYAQQAVLIYSQVDPAGAAQWTGIRNEIEAEEHEQRNRLNDLSNVVEPELLKTKLALLGDQNE